MCLLLVILVRVCLRVCVGGDFQSVGAPVSFFFFCVFAPYSFYSAATIHISAASTIYRVWYGGSIQNKRVFLFFGSTGGSIERATKSIFGGGKLGNTVISVFGIHGLM